LENVIVCPEKNGVPNGTDPRVDPVDLNTARQKALSFFEVIQLLTSLFDMFISNTLSKSASSPSGDETSIYLHCIKEYVSL
jgi:hypothetical protein